MRRQSITSGASEGARALAWLILTLSLMGCVVIGWALWEHSDVDHAAIVGLLFGATVEALVIVFVLFLLADIRDAAWFLAQREELRQEEENVERLMPVRRASPATP
jgi:uncharacterized membrane protein